MEPASAHVSEATSPTSRRTKMLALLAVVAIVAYGVRAHDRFDWVMV